MSLLNANRASSRALIKQLQQKAKKVEKAKTTTKKGGSLLTRIQNICDSVQKTLGHYADQLICIKTEEELHNYIDVAIKNGIIAIDTETTGLDPITDQIVGACIYTYNEKPAYIPINHISLVTNERIPGQLTNEQVAKEFQRLVDSNVKCIFFNAKFDIRVMRHQLGVYINPAWCGFIAAKCLKNNEPEASLKALWKKYCCPPDFNEPVLTFDKMFEGLTFNIVPINTAYLYAAKDALMTLQLYDYQKPLLTETDEKCINSGYQNLAKLYNEIELPIISIVADIEDTGVTINIEYAKELSIKYNEKLKKAEEAFHTELAKYKDQLDAYLAVHPDTKIESPINIASTTQLAELFYDVLKQPSVSKKKPRGTGNEELTKMGHPLGKLVLEHRGIAKLLNTYIDKLPNSLNKKTGRIHCSFNQYGTDCLSGDTLIPTKDGIFTIRDLCEANIDNMEYNKFYNLKIGIYNKNKEIEYTSHAIKFKEIPTITLTFNDGSLICGTYDHPILCNGIFKELKDLRIGDLVDSRIKENDLKITRIEYYINDVYDFKVPGTHSFISNNVISHNTGRFSSSDPNLQNIPSHNTDIRPMFIATREEKIQSKNNIFNLYYDDLIYTINGLKDSQDLQPGDILKCEDGNFTIKNVVKQDIFIQVEI